MSIYGTILSIQDIRQEAESMKAHGINFGVIADDGEVEDLDMLPDEDLSAPWVYQGSHVLPARDDQRGGSVDLAMVPAHITRDGRDDGHEGPKDWLRLSVEAHPDSYGEGISIDGGPYAVVVLDREQAERLRDTLTNWLEREEAT